MAMMGGSAFRARKSLTQFGKQKERDALVLSRIALASCYSHVCSTWHT